MEHKIPFFPVLLSFFIFILMVSRIWKNKNQNSNPPPGPRKLPLIGNIPQLIGDLPHLRLRDLAKKYGPIMSLQLGEIPAVIISSGEIAKEVLKTQELEFANRPLILAAKVVLYAPKELIYGPYGENWKQLRKFCTVELLSAKRVQSFKAVRDEEISNLMKYVHSNSGSLVNLTEHLFSLTNSIMAISSIGKRCKHQESILNIIDEVIVAGGGFSIADVYPSIKFLHYLTGEQSRLQRLHVEADHILEEILAEQRAIRRSREHHTEADNLLDVLLNLQENGKLQVPLTNDSIKAVIVEMFGAGTDTSAKTTEWALSELMRSPRVMKKVQEEVRRVFGEIGKVDESKFQDLKYMKLIIKETLRLHPPVSLIPRECRVKAKVEGYDIYPKTKVLVNLYAIGRDPKVWPEAEKFWPERFEDSPIDYKGTHLEFIPFGAGKRICPGMILGLTNLEAFLANLLYHFDWMLPDGVTHDTLDMTEAFGGALKRKTDLKLIPIPIRSLPSN